MADQINSESDERTVNNAVRHQYKVLNEDEKQQILDIKDLGAEFIQKLRKIGGTHGTSLGEHEFGSRDLSLANTHIEDAVMRAVRHITS